MEAAALLKQSRRRAGLTQSELARRMGTTQSAVARLERPGSNPRLQTLASALRAAGRDLELAATPAAPGVDETQIVDRLRLTPAERLATFQASSGEMRRLLERASVPRDRSA